MGCGAIAMGIGIWAMHLKGMLAFRMPVAVLVRLAERIGIPNGKP